MKNNREDSIVNILAPILSYRRNHKYIATSDVSDADYLKGYVA
jgi:hypothetical protein